MSSRRWFRKPTSTNEIILLLPDIKLDAFTCSQSLFWCCLLTSKDTNKHGQCTICLQRNSSTQHFCNIFWRSTYDHNVLVCLHTYIADSFDSPSNSAMMQKSCLQWVIDVVSWLKCNSQGIMQRTHEACWCPWLPVHNHDLIMCQGHSTKCTWFWLDYVQGPSMKCTVPERMYRNLKQAASSKQE